jgi:hypothetical protein
MLMFLGGGEGNLKLQEPVLVNYFKTQTQQIFNKKLENHPTLVITGSPLRCERIYDFYFASQLPGSSLQNLEKQFKTRTFPRTGLKIKPKTKN